MALKQITGKELRKPLIGFGSTKRMAVASTESAGYNVLTL